MAIGGGEDARGAVLALLRRAGLPSADDRHLGLQRPDGGAHRALVGVQQPRGQILLTGGVQQRHRFRRVEREVERLAALLPRGHAVAVAQRLAGERVLA